MSTYLKFIVIAALFITTGAASVLGDSSASSPSTTDQTSVKQSSAKEEKNSNVSNEKVVEPHTESSTSVNPSTNSTSTSSEEASATSSNEGQEAASSAAENTTTSSKEAAEASNRPAPTVNEAEPTNETTATEESQNTPAPATIGADQLMINGQAISYTNAGQGSGQAIIDANPNQVATWGGAVVQSGNDGANTHFIGHNPGIFNVLFSLGTGATIEVSDSANNVTTYTVSQIVTVDDSGFAADGTDYWDQITGSGGGERITLQTCINDDYNLIVFANK